MNNHIIHKNANPLSCKTTYLTKCPFCQNKNNPVVVDTDQDVSWQNGLLIQNAFPNLSADERELLLTGICKECFPSEDE